MRLSIELCNDTVIPIALKKVILLLLKYLKGIVNNPHLPYRNKLAEFTGANRFSVRCAVFE
jgi:hypothetical protein